MRTLRVTHLLVRFGHGIGALEDAASAEPAVISLVLAPRFVPTAIAVAAVVPAAAAALPLAVNTG